MKGSWFIMSLCEVFEKYAQEEDVLSMLVKVSLQSEGDVRHCFSFSLSHYVSTKSGSLPMTDESQATNGINS